MRIAEAKAASGMYAGGGPPGSFYVRVDNISPAEIKDVEGLKEFARKAAGGRALVKAGGRVNSGDGTYSVAFWFGSAMSGARERRRLSMSDVICYLRVCSARWCQEHYESASGHARIRAAELRKLGYDVTVSSLGPQVTGVGVVKMTMVDARWDPNFKDAPPPPARIERLASRADRIALAAVNSELERQMERARLASSSGFRAWYEGEIKKKYPKFTSGEVREIVDFVQSMWDEEMEQDVQRVGYQSALVRMVQRRPIIGNYLRDVKKQYEQYGHLID